MIQHILKGESPCLLLQRQRKKYLKWYQKLAYGSGDPASNCSYGLVSSFVLLYLTGTLGLDSAIIGSLMLASKVLDGISDVIFGTRSTAPTPSWARHVRGCCLVR